MSEKSARSIVRARFGQLFPPARTSRKPEPTRRLQKNLSLPERDVLRMKTLSERDHISQARLIARALDAYEEAYGKLGG